MIYALGLVLLLVGLYGVLSKKNIVKIIISVVIMEGAVNLFFVLLGYREKGISPVINNPSGIDKIAGTAVDPLPQALVLMSMAVGLGILIVMISLAARLYERYGTLDITQIRKLKG